MYTHYGFAIIMYKSVKCKSNMTVGKMLCGSVLMRIVDYLIAVVCNFVTKYDDKSLNIGRLFHSLNVLFLA
jgi:hypothetical protein